MGTHAGSDITALTAVKVNLIACPDCHLVCRQSDDGNRTGARLQCPRCGAVLHKRIPKSLMRTWAFLIAALICYLPANILPVTITTSLGQRQADTILSGVIYFVTSGAWYLALVIFVASILVPMLKLLVLTFLLISVHTGSAWRPEERTRLYRIVEAVGRWSMLDIFVVAVLAALVRMQSLASIEAGPGALFFGAVVVITMLAAQSFDPRLIWDAAERSK